MAWRKIPVDAAKITVEEETGMIAAAEEMTGEITEGMIGETAEEMTAVAVMTVEEEGMSLLCLLLEEILTVIPAVAIFRRITDSRRITYPREAESDTK